MPDKPLAKSKVQTMRTLRSATICILVCFSIGSFSSGDETARYRLTFDSVWSGETHPTDYPGVSAHYSGLIGGTHNANVSFWEMGGFATTGVQRMAETGSKAGFSQEVAAAIADGNAGAEISGPGMGTTPGSVSVEFEASREFPLATVTSMIAPSPDWFVGTSGLSLLDNESWVGKIVHELHPYDAGTDSGVTFRSSNSATSPAEPIQDLSSVFPFENTGPLGTFTFLRLLAGDFNESGTVDEADVDRMAQALRAGDSDAMFDLDGDANVSAADRDFLIHDILNTFYGDANLDGEFNSSDLTRIFQAAEYEDNVAGNSTWATGDWDGDSEFTTSDLVLAFQEGAYEQGPVNVLPEPNSLSLLAVSLLLIFRRLR